MSTISWPLALTLTASAALPRIAEAKAPGLLVVVSVDQLSADLFAEYRQHFTGGLARLANGVVFPSGYQSHAATETCPGHSTILTGDRPARTGIIANDWVDQRSVRGGAEVYCAEDERVPGTTSKAYVVSDLHLKVPTLGDLMKAADGAVRVASVAGKDRAAVMMGGHHVDELWWWKGGAFTSLAGKATPPAVLSANEALRDELGTAQPGFDLPAVCRQRDRTVMAGAAGPVGSGRFARPAQDAEAFRASPELDVATVQLATALRRDLKLGQRGVTDLLIVGLSATDYVGHTYGTEGAEMCIQLLALDAAVGQLLWSLDAAGVDYAVVLTADHGGHDLPERSRLNGAPSASRVDRDLSIKEVGRKVAGKLQLAEPVLLGRGPGGDVWVNAKLGKGQRVDVLREAKAIYSSHRQVAAVFSRDEVLATPTPSGPPETWTLAERARASFDPDRSGDLVVALKPRVTAIEVPSKGSVATHGSFWDYDRRVPILFWRKGIVPFEQPLSVETVDIMPSLAALIGLSPGDVDGRCLDLVAGEGSSCP